MYKIKGSKILVTGGAGFIGSHIVDSLVSEGAEVIVYDNFSFGNEENLRESKDKIKIVKADLLDFQRLEKAAKGVDYICHLAAQLEIFKSAYEPEHDLYTNTFGTLNVLKAALKVKAKKVVVASSACVYGQPLKIPQSENHPLDPNWAYGVSKLASEKYCQIFSHDTGIPTVNLRFGIVFGSREWYRRVLTLFIKRAAEGKNPVVFGHGLQFRDFVYVEDIVRLHNLALTKKNADGKIYNGGTGKKTTIKKLAQLIVKISGDKNLRPVFEDVKEGTESKLVPGKRRNLSDLDGMCLSYKKANTELGWIPKVTLEEGIKKTFDWYLKNPDRWNVIKYTDKKESTRKN